jgi:hypothetical protein
VPLLEKSGQSPLAESLSAGRYRPRERQARKEASRSANIFETGKHATSCAARGDLYPMALGPPPCAMCLARKIHVLVTGRSREKGEKITESAQGEATLCSRSRALVTEMGGMVRQEHSTVPFPRLPAYGGRQSTSVQHDPRRYELATS